MTLEGKDSDHQTSPIYNPASSTRQLLSSIVRFKDEMGSSRLACMQLLRVAIMTQHNQGPSPNRCTSYTFVDDGGSVNIPRLAGINNAALSLTRGEAARAQGDEIVFDVHLPSSRLIETRAWLYATFDESWPLSCGLILTITAHTWSSVLSLLHHGTMRTDPTVSCRTTGMA